MEIRVRLAALPQELSGGVSFRRKQDGGNISRMRKHYSTGVAVALLLFASAPALAEVDLTGVWAGRFYEDFPERVPGPDMVEFHGLPINEANRQRGLSWDPSILTLEEYQCRPHPADYYTRGAQNRMWKEIDSTTQQTIAWHLRFQWQAAERTIWMDGRDRPPAYAAHTFQGFALGHWEGDVLTEETTHLKESYLRRNGLSRSDKASFRAHYIRHDNVLTVVAVTNDPVYLTEPYIRSTDYVLDNRSNITPYPCDTAVEIFGQARGYVPHYLPGKHPSQWEYAERYNLSHEAVMGGAETMYPEFMTRVLGSGAQR